MRTPILHGRFGTLTPMQKLLAGVLVVTALVPVSSAFAQQLRLTEGTETSIDAEVYRAYYGKLTGEPHQYTFSTDVETPIKVVLVVPDVPDAKTNISATLVDATDSAKFFSAADGTQVEWQRFFDTAGRDSYLAGPMLDATLPPGEYRIQVSNPGDDAQYALIVSNGEKAPFSIFETIRRYATVPTIKSDFFDKPAYQAYLTPLLLWPIFGTLIFLALIIFAILIYRRRSAI